MQSGGICKGSLRQLTRMKLQRLETLRNILTTHLDNLFSELL